MPSSQGTKISAQNFDELNTQLNIVIKDIYAWLDQALQFDGKGTIITLKYGGLGADISGYAGILTVLSGAASQIKFINDATKYLDSTGKFSVPSVGSLAWGNITGTLSNQSDLETALSGLQTSITNLQNSLTALQPGATIVTSTPYNILATDDVIVANLATAGVLNLPAASGSKKKYYVKNVNTGAATLTPNGTDTIDGSNSGVAFAQWDHKIICDYASGKWAIIG